MKRYKLYITALIVCLLGVAAGITLYWLTPQRDPLIYGRELLHAGKYSEAEEEFKKVLQKDPANIKALSVLGTLYYRQGDIKLAYQYWNEALKIVPNDSVLRSLVKAMEQDNLKPGTLYHMEIQTVDHAQPWERHFVNGQNMYLKGEYPKAIEELKKAIRLRSDDPKIYFVLGAAYLKMNEREQTIRAWEKALKINPEDPMIRDLISKVKNRNREGR